MIQELFSGNNVGIIGGERNKFDGSPSHNSPSVSPSPPSAAASATPENLRCPRCDSSNTKFCYYNNYNLTQPRHFCKTCRRYWTKGGALRNVPIGGGCRKNKNAAITAAVGKSGQKAKTASSERLFSGFEHVDALSSNPIIWASSQNSHFLSLLRSNPNPISVKEELSAASLFTSSHMNARALGLGQLGPAHLPAQFLSSGQGGFFYGDHNTGLQEAYQRLRSSSNCYPDHAPSIHGTSATAILDSSPVAAGEMGFWNPNLSWPTDSSAYP
ncbi:hypothetical protein ACS0TY_029781 [Phlomoides rotata]